MKRLIIVRHGEYGYGGDLNNHGRLQMEELARNLQPTLNGQSTAVLTSIAPRARQSADIIGRIIGITPEEHEVLWSDNQHRENLPGALELVRSKKDEVEVLILVTHLEYSEEFPQYFAHQELACDTFPYRVLSKGEAWDIDCEKKTCTRVIL